VGNETGMTSYSWVLDSGGAGRGAWQGGVIHQFMQWARSHQCFPVVSMGASAGGYAAADVATGTEATVMKGWTQWGRDESLMFRSESIQERRLGGFGNFRHHLVHSIRYVMGETEIGRVFDSQSEKKLLIFTTRVRRRDGRAIRHRDLLRYFFKSITRKLPAPLKYIPSLYREEPVIFTSPLPPSLESEYVRALTRHNYHRVIEASCLVPLAMGSPVLPEQLNRGCAEDFQHTGRPDEAAVFMDGSFALKMPMARFAEDSRFQPLAQWARADKTVVFCCDPAGDLWETSSRLRRLNDYPLVTSALEEKRLLAIHPDHKIEAGFLCCDNRLIMRTFCRGQEQAERLLKSEKVKRFFDV